MICMDQAADTVAVQCMHLSYCSACAEGLQKCSFCQCETAFKRVFFTQV